MGVDNRRVVVVKKPGSVGWGGVWGAKVDDACTRLESGRILSVFCIILFIATDNKCVRAVYFLLPWTVSGPQRPSRTYPLRRLTRSSQNDES